MRRVAVLALGLALAAPGVSGVSVRSTQAHAALHFKDKFLTREAVTQRIQVRLRGIADALEGLLNIVDFPQRFRPEAARSQLSREAEELLHSGDPLGSMFIRELAQQVPMERFFKQRHSFVDDLLGSQGPSSDEVKVQRDGKGNVVTTTVHCEQGECSKFVQKQKAGGQSARRKDRDVATVGIREAVQKMAEEMKSIFSGPHMETDGDSPEMSDILKDIMGAGDQFPWDNEVEDEAMVSDEEDAEFPDEDEDEEEEAKEEAPEEEAAPEEQTEVEEDAEFPDEDEEEEAKEEAPEEEAAPEEHKHTESEDMLDDWFKHMDDEVVDQMADKFEEMQNSSGSNSTNITEGMVEDAPHGMDAIRKDLEDAMDDLLHDIFGDGGEDTEESPKVIPLPEGNMGNPTEDEETTLTSSRTEVNNGKIRQETKRCKRGHCVTEVHEEDMPVSK